MRYFIIVYGEEVVPPWVLAESPDESWAKDRSSSWEPSVALSRDEALLDPDYREAVLAWEAKDDRHYGAFLALEEIDAAAKEAQEQVRREAWERGEYASREEYEQAVLEEIRAQEKPRSPDPDPERDLLSAAHAHLTVVLLEWYHRAEELRPGLGKMLARVLARESKDLAVGRRGRLL